MKNRQDLIKRIAKGSVVAELGVFKGVFAEDIINICQPKEAYLVDLFSGNIMSGDVNGENIEYHEGGNLKKLVQQKFKNHSEVFVQQGCSVKFLEEIPDNFFDFIYIDSSHLYDQTKRELDLGFLKVKAGGVIAGHDYHTSADGVIRAVDEFCELHSLDLELTTEDKIPSFFIRLKK
jgi:hypothetical protein